uniref:DUF2185 domain-containing protein n=1 Tax=Parastrongyloides trichosuri TaxID=131310 RepID=A0A0N4ZFN3_PARTI
MTSKTIYSNNIKESNGECNYQISTLWNGEKLSINPVLINFKYKGIERNGILEKNYLYITFEAPFYDDPSPEDFSGYTPELWNYEVVEFFFSNNSGQYIEIELGPHGHWLVYAFDEYRKMRNNCEDIDLEVQNSILPDNTWKCVVGIPIGLLPNNVSKFNVYHIHGKEPNRIYEALFPSTNKEQKNPDFHKLEFFKKFNTRCIFPSNFSELQKDDIDYNYIWNL